MHRFKSIVFVSFICFTGLSQQVCGEADSTTGIKIEGRESPIIGIPGHWKKEPTSEDDTEISRLNVLIENQQKKINLLESKVELLETELKKQKIK